jgi:hypothetical protein
MSAAPKDAIFEFESKLKMAKRGNPKWKRGGISPNPGGRSRELAQLQNAARLEAASHACEVIGYLLKVLRSEEEGTAYRLKAGIELLDRGLGKPQQQVDIEVLIQRKLTELTVDELQLLEERLTLAPPPFLLESNSGDGNGGDSSPRRRGRS